MCMFGGSSAALTFLEVSKTNIFARADGARQFLVYSMNVAATEPVAMILPLPVPASSPEDAVSFLDLSAYPDLFADVVRCFPPIIEPLARGAVGGGPTAMMTQSLLEVHEAGDFEASFVPSLADFSRLDPRFRIEPSIWDALPNYADWGFAVFQLRDLGANPPKQSWWARLFGGGSDQRVDRKTIHPMALSFPRRFDDRLFLPTVHVHDGELHERCEFDHSLFWQSEGEQLAVPGPNYSDPAKTNVDVERALGIVDGERGIHLHQLVGGHPNEDHWAIAQRVLGDAATGPVTDAAT